MTTSLRKSSSPRSSYKSLKTSEDDVSSIKGAHIPTSAAASDDNNNNNNNSNSNQSSSRSVSSSSSPSSSAETKTRAERLADKIQALLWVSIATAVGWYLDLPMTLLTDLRIHRTPFNIATVLFMINLVLVSYLGIYLPKVVGIHDSSAWDAYCPRVIPIMTFNGIVCGILAVRSLWPVWGFLTPFIFGLEFFGVLYAMHFVPWI